MPQFQYEVKAGPGKPQVGVMDAESPRACISRLREMGYFPIRVEEYKGEKRKRFFNKSLARIKLKDKNIFFRQLANLFDSGMPLTRALTTLVDQTDHERLSEVIAQIREDVTKGATFAEALERHPKVFSPLQVNLVRAGESGGMLDEVLWRLVTFGEQEEELRGRASSAMIYPAFLFVMGSLAIFILVSFVFPKFAGVFEDFNADLPWPTVVTMAVADFMGAYWWAVLIVVFFFIGALISYWRTPKGREQIDAGLLRSPLVGKVIQRYEMAKFARTLGTLIDNGVPILTSIKITADTLGNRVIAKEVAGIHSKVSEGDSISESLEGSKYFPPMVVSMFAVGEEGGRLGAVSKRIADAYDNEVDRAVKAMTAMLEPIMIVVMGVIVGFLVISMLLPILQLSAQVA